MRKSLRYLRIFWTVFSGIACVLLCVMWVRSYSGSDCLYWENSPVDEGCLRTVGGALHIIGTHPLLSPFAAKECGYWLDGTLFGKPHPIWLPSYEYSYWAYPHRSSLLIPFWMLVLPTILVAVIPWIRWLPRFSLSTLLIATTLIAVLLGLIVWLSR